MKHVVLEEAARRGICAALKRAKTCELVKEEGGDTIAVALKTDHYAALLAQIATLQAMLEDSERENEHSKHSQPQPPNFSATVSPEELLEHIG
jgi:hypothetical protein